MTVRAPAFRRICLTADVAMEDGLEDIDICKVIARSGTEIPVQNCTMYVIQGGYVYSYISRTYHACTHIYS